METEEIETFTSLEMDFWRKPTGISKDTAMEQSSMQTVPFTKETKCLMVGGLQQESVVQEDLGFAAI